MQKAKPGYKLVKWYFGKEIEIPEEWEQVFLKHKSKKIGDGIHATPNYVDESNYYFINGNNLNEGVVCFFDQTKHVSKEEYRKYRLDLNQDTVFLSINGTIGNVAFYNDEKIVLGKSVCYIICDNSLNKKFLFYVLQVEYFQKFINRELTGTTISNLSLATVRNIPLLFPPLPEQQKIAFILSSVDELINHYDRTINSTKKLKSGLMQTLLTNGIGHKKFKKTRLFPKYSDEKIPEDWNIDRIENLIKIIDYRGRTPPFSDQGIPHLRSNNIRHEKIILNDLTYVSKTTYDEYMTRGIPEKNDVLFTTEGPLGEVALVPENFIFSLAQRIIVLRSKSKKLHYGFLMYLLQDRKIKTRYEGLSTGTTLGGIASKWFTRLLLPFPESYDEQQKIASILSSVDDNINKLESKKDSLDKIKKGLMQKLLTGQIRVAA